MTKILLLGFENPLRDDLVRVLTGLRYVVGIQGFQDEWLAQREAHLVFCSGDDPRFRDALRDARFLRPDLPLVVVTRLPEVSAWLDALEAGAADYCSAPFEPIQMRWVLNSALPERQMAAA